ncbi:MAG: sensor histidine kinase [Prochloraceae cyanobacterium]
MVSIVPKTFRNSPLKFLFYLNWILLSIVFLSILNPQYLPFDRSDWLNFFCLLIFALMGFKIVELRRTSEKLIYLSLEFLIIILTYWGGLKFSILLYLILVVRNSFIFSRSSRFAVTMIVFVLVPIAQYYRVQTLKLPPQFLEDRLKIFWITTILLGILFLFLQLLVDTVLSEYESRKKLAIANEKLRRYAAKIEDIATLQERNRIAREIHDSLGHSLTIFNLHLEAALKILPCDPKEATELLKEAKQVGKTALKDVRQSVATLRSNPLEGKSLPDAIGSLIEDLKKSTGIEPQCDLNIFSSISDEIKITIYRILQEAITNICKYSEATEVIIKIEINTDLKLIIRDNGVGFILDENTTGFGLQGMEERTKALGGNFQIITAPDRGCKISVSLPINKL